MSTHGEVIFNDENGELRVVAIPSEKIGVHFLHFLQEEQKISEEIFCLISFEIKECFKQGP